MSALHTPRPEDIPAAVADVCCRLRAAGFEAWVVGGAVRDLLLGRRVQDFDIASSARPDDVARLFGKRRTILTGVKHGTVTVLVEARGPAAERAARRASIEVTTYRGEGAYSDGRRPDQVSFVQSLEEDLERRDFTINALAYDPVADRLADLVGGSADLERRVIRAVGVPLERFREDGLRPLRAVRFAAQLEFQLDDATREAIPRALDIFRKVSAERVRDELLKILGSRRPSIGLELMRSTGLLGEVIPELLEAVGVAQNRFHALDVWRHTLATVDATTLVGGESPWLARMAALLHDVAKPRTRAERPDAPGENSFYRHEQVGAEMAEQILTRLKLPRRERQRIVHLVLNHMFWYSPEWTDGTVRRFIGRIGPDALEELFALREADVRARGRGEDPEREVGELKQRIAKQIEQDAALKVSDLAIGGTDVMRVLGCKPGPMIGEVLRRLLERVLDDAELNTYERLEALVPVVAGELGEGKP